MSASPTATGASTPWPDPLPLFPLKMVLFPGSILGLKIFEARYLDMVGHCLRSSTPFGVICLQSGNEAGRSDALQRLETVGTVAHIDEVDAEQAGILRLRCHGGQRFKLTEAPVQRDNGQWVGRVEPLRDDAPRGPGPAMMPTVTALAEAIQKLQQQDHEPFAKPYRLDHAGWIANRWCELLPISLAAKQKLMELDDPVIRLSLVDGYLRDKKVVIG